MFVLLLRPVLGSVVGIRLSAWRNKHIIQFGGRRLKVISHHNIVLACLTLGPGGIGRWCWLRYSKPEKRARCTSQKYLDVSKDAFGEEKKP